MLLFGGHSSEASKACYIYTNTNPQEEGSIHPANTVLSSADTFNHNGDILCWPQSDKEAVVAGSSGVFEINRESLTITQLTIL